MVVRVSALAVVLVCSIFLSISGVATGAADVEYVNCTECYIHPDSKNEDIAVCSDELVRCPMNEGCWLIKKETHIIKGCLSKLLEEKTAISVQYSEEEETYCTEFWRKEICLHGTCIRCDPSEGPPDGGRQLQISLPILILGTVLSFYYSHHWYS